MKNKKANALRQREARAASNDMQLSRATARMFIVGGLHFAQDMNRGFTSDAYKATRARGRRDQRARHFERMNGSIEALFFTGLITLASAERCAFLLRAYCIDNEWTRRDADESFSRAMDGAEA